MRIPKTIRPKNVTPSTDVVMYPRIKISNYELQSIRAASLESPRQLGEVLLPYCIIMATMRSIRIDDGCFATLDPKFKRTHSVRNRFEAKIDLRRSGEIKNPMPAYVLQLSSKPAVINTYPLSNTWAPECEILVSWRHRQDRARERIVLHSC